jgi:hypothetical protein
VSEPSKQQSINNDVINNAIDKMQLRKVESEVTIGHLRMGMGSSLGQRRPDDDDEGGSGGQGLLAHPLLTDSQYFAGVPENITANTKESADAEHNAERLAPEQRPNLTLSNDLTNTKANRAGPTAPRPAGT